MLLIETGSTELGLNALAELIMSEERVDFWRIARVLITTLMPALGSTIRRELFLIVFEHVGYLVRPERAMYSVAGERDSLSTAEEMQTPCECVDAWLISLLDHPNRHMRNRAASVLEWLSLHSELSIPALVGRVASGPPGDGREIAVGILHQLASTRAEVATQVTSSARFERLLVDPHFLVGFLVEDVLGGVRKPVQSEPGTAVAPSTEQVPFGFNATDLLELEEGSEGRAHGWARELASPLSVAELRELSDIRRTAFGGPSCPGGYGFEREAVFRALGNVQGTKRKKKLLDASLWNPWWPDADLRLDRSLLIPEIVKRIESSEWSTAFEHGDETVLHCIEARPREGDSPLDLREVIAVLVCKEFFEGPPDPEGLFERMSVFDREPPPGVGSILALSSEPAVARFEPEFRIGGDMTPALPSRRMIELVGPQGFDRVCWCDGRRWDLWGPGPVLSRGTALTCRSTLMRGLEQHDLLWMVLRDGVPTHVVHQRRGLIYQRDPDDAENE